MASRTASNKKLTTHLGVTPKVITIDPVTRIEGHLKIQVEIDHVGAQQQVVDAWSTGTLFRGFELLLNGRHPWDAIPITQRICGVCPVSHAMAASMALDAAAGVAVPDNGRLMRNIVLGANFIQSHLLHFYHLAAMDFVEGPNMAPWKPDWSTDKRLDAATNETLVEHYVQALEMRRKAHELGAVFGAKLPHPASYVPGGFTPDVTAARIAACQSYLSELIPFIDAVWLPDLMLLAGFYGDYFEIGRGVGNLLAFGVFDLDATGGDKLLRRGQVRNASAQVQPVDPDAITEHITHSWYADTVNKRPPANGVTSPQYPKDDAYSWMKAPRYVKYPYEVGPLARMWINGDYEGGISVLDRHLARAQEAAKIAQAMAGWLGQLEVGGEVYAPNTVPQSATAFGLTEAPRGALGHWISIDDKKIASYQVVTPTCWNASPRCMLGLRGPIEEALIGTPVTNAEEPIEVLRVVHSFDPCLACAVHVMRPGEGAAVEVLTGQPAWAASAR